MESFCTMHHFGLIVEFFREDVRSSFRPFLLLPRKMGVRMEKTAFVSAGSKPMIKSTDISLRPLAGRIREGIPDFKISLANAYAIRGSTPKGDYEVRAFLKNNEIRTTFLRRGSNPLKGMRLLCRTAVRDGEFPLDEHIAAIQANQAKLPLVERRTDPENGDQYVTIMPFGAGATAPRVVIRRSSRTGFISMDVRDACEMSPIEARLIGKAINRACKIAAAERASVVPTDG